MGGGVRRHSRKIKRQRVQRPEGQSYKETVRENESFEKYYKAQGIVPEAEWDEFISKLRSDLPTSFRVMAKPPWEAAKLMKIISSMVEEDRRPVVLPWYPGGLAWQVELSRRDIRRSETFFRLHNFLMSETAVGAISRQEAVSMIPPLLLDVQPNHRVLDMCAAPGSKTAQLLEALHASDDLPTGLVVANDLDNARCYMLVHQAKRVNSPCLIVTNHDSSAMPNFTLASGQTLKFDRVLCDGPCSSDGTLRKNPDIWTKWNAANGNNLHGVQFRLLKRGMEMLAIGGRLVYSTCSMNPVEDEAVIDRFLSEAQESAELVEVADLVPGLVMSRGVSKWVVASKDLAVYENYSEVPEKWQTQVRPQMFPSGKQHNLDRCLRILPHHQNTGGFFVAVLTKKALLPWEGTSTEPPPKKKAKVYGYKEDPFVFLEGSDPLWSTLRDFYGIDDGLDATCLLTRCATGKKKNIYMVTPLVKEIISSNPQVKIINSGVKTFARCDAKAATCDFRLVQEGLVSIHKHIKSRRVALSGPELVSLLEAQDPQLTTILQPETQTALTQITPGSCVLDSSSGVTLVGWRGTCTLRVYIPTPEAVHYLRLHDADVSAFEVNKFKKEEDQPQPEENQPLPEEDKLLPEDDKLLPEKDKLLPEEDLPQPSSET